jgi:glycosyltransferase involved in cell wall biosynthesis
MSLRPPPEPPLPTGGSTPLRYRILLAVEASFAGAGQHVLDLAEGLLTLGQEVHLAYSPRRMEPRFADALQVLRAKGLVTTQVSMGPEPGFEDLAAVWRIRRYLMTAGPFHVVHGHSSKAGAVVRLAATGLGVRRVYTPHAFKTMDPECPRGRFVLYSAVERLLARFATDRLVLTSTEEARHARSQGMPVERTTVIPHGVRVPDDLPDRAQARASFDLAQDALVVAWIGRFVSQKAPERFIPVVAGLRRELPDLHALMLGYGQLEAPVRDLIRTYGLATIVRLHTDRRGWDALAAADLLVLTSRYEAMPYVVLEAQALGVPVVATDVAGLRDMAAASSIRIVPNADDATELVAHVRAVLAERKQFPGRAPPKASPGPAGTIVMAQTILESYLLRDRGENPASRAASSGARSQRTASRPL